MLDDVEKYAVGVYSIFSPLHDFHFWRSLFSFIYRHILETTRSDCVAVSFWGELFSGILRAWFSYRKGDQHGAAKSSADT